MLYYKMLEEQYGQLERLRHDMKNHIIGLRGLWESREWEKLGAYLEPAVGKSGVNHRLRRLCKIAEEIRQKNCEDM